MEKYLVLHNMHIAGSGAFKAGELIEKSRYEAIVASSPNSAKFFKAQRVSKEKMEGDSPTKITKKQKKVKE